MRPHISIRGSVRPSVGPSVRNALVEMSRLWEIIVRNDQDRFKPPQTVFRVVSICPKMSHIVPKCPLLTHIIVQMDLFWPFSKLFRHFASLCLFKHTFSYHFGSLLGQSGAFLVNLEHYFKLSYLASANCSVQMTLTNFSDWSFVTC